VNAFIADKTLLSLILGGWLLFYCYQRDISGIKAAAYWGVLGIISFLVLIIVDLLYRSWTEDMLMDKTLNFISLNIFDEDFPSCFACLILSFSFHSYTFSIYECLESPSPKKMLISSSIGIFISTLIYLLVGSIGYILYGKLLTDSILDTMGTSTLSIMTSICFVINVIMSFPLSFSALKHYFCFLLQIILTLLRDCSKCCKKDLSATTNTNLIDKHDPHSVTQTVSKPIHSKESNTREDEYTSEVDEETDVHQEESHHKLLNYVQIPEWVEFILIFLLFISIFYVANKYQKMKIVYNF
jgi:hypothetical protein